MVTSVDMASWGLPLTRATLWQSVNQPSSLVLLINGLRTSKEQIGMGSRFSIFSARLLPDEPMDTLRL